MENKQLEENFYQIISKKELQLRHSTVAKACAAITLERMARFHEWFEENKNKKVESKFHGEVTYETLYTTEDLINLYFESLNK